MLTAVLLFVAGLVMLVKGGDWFVDGAAGLAHRLHIPEIIIGATIVSIGTTLPEVMVSATGALSGHPQIAYGNAIGSIVCNTSLIAALTIALRPSAVDRKALRVPVVFFFGTAVLYCLSAYISGGFSRLFGIGLLLCFAAYIILTMKSGMGAETEESEEESKDMPLWKQLVLLAVGAALIAFGADLLVDNGTLIAEGLGVPESVIALTFVALGTSLPELVTAITSLVKGHSSLSLGNVIGANLFNIVLVNGVAVTLAPFSLPEGGTALYFDIPVMLFVMLLLTVPALKKGRLYRWQGVTLLAIYAAYVIAQFVI